MTHNIILPKLSDAMHQATMKGWLKSIGETLMKGEAIAEVETGSVIMPIMSTVEGIIKEFLIKEDEVVSIGTTIAIVVENEKKEILSENIKTNDNIIGEGEKDNVDFQDLDKRVTICNRDDYIFVTKEIDYEGILAKKKNCNNDGDENITSNDIIMYAVIMALKDIPEINCLNNVVYESINLAFCVNTEAVSHYPVLPIASAKNINLLSSETKRIIHAIRNGKLEEVNFNQPTFTIYNLGADGMNSFFILPSTETCCLSFTSPISKPIVTDNNEVVVGKLLKFCLSSNQKNINSTMCAAFLNRLSEIINND
ncbi:MAG: hypothetical protein CMI31_11925 [Opitutae bacterium]|nr:hypothetical protein [Opitutae bacterium]